MKAPKQKDFKWIYVMYGSFVIMNASRWAQLCSMAAVISCIERLYKSEI